MKTIFLLIFLACPFTTMFYSQQGRLNLSKNTYHVEQQDYWIVDSTSGIYTFSGNGKLGLADKNGQLLTRARFDIIEPFHASATVVTQNGKYGIINKKGNLIVPCEYESIKPFWSSVTAFGKKGQYGIIDETGKIVSTQTYWHLSSFYEGMGIGLNNNGDYLLIDSTGKEQLIINRYRAGLSYQIKNELLDMAFTSVIEDHKLPLYKYEKGIARGINPETLQYCFVDKEGKQLFNKDFEYILPFNGKYAAVKTTKGWNYIDRNGELQSSKWHPELAVYNNVMIQKKDSLLGVVDSTQKTIIPFKYQSIVLLNDYLFAVLQKDRWGKGSKWGVININNQSILPCIYEGISFDSTTGIGKAGVFDHSTSLHTGVPRYNFYGHYFLFDASGIIDSTAYPYSMLVEGISDLHLEDVPHHVSSFAPPKDIHARGLTVSISSNSSGLKFFSSGYDKTITVTDCYGKQIISGPFYTVDVYSNCIVARDNNEFTIYDHFGNRIYKTKNPIIHRNENGTFIMYLIGGSSSQFIDAQGNKID